MTGQGGGLNIQCPMTNIQFPRVQPGIRRRNSRNSPLAKDAKGAKNPKPGGRFLASLACLARERSGISPQIRFVIDHGLGGIDVPRPAAGFAEAAGGIRAPRGQEERMRARRDLGFPDAQLPQAPEDFPDLRRAMAPSAAFWQNAVVPDDPERRLLPRIVRPEPDEIIARPAQENARPDRVRMRENLAVELRPRRRDPPPAPRLRLHQRRIAPLEQGQN